MLSLNDPLVDSVPVPPPPRPRPRQELILILRERTARVPATYLLLALNVVVYAALAAATGSFTQFSAAELVKWGADYGPRTTNGEWWRLLTATFLHAHALHLIFNMTALLMVGPVVERLIGTRAFLAFYIGCGLAGSAASLWAHPWLAAVGASGAIMGTYGVLLALMFERCSTPAHAGAQMAAAPIRRAQLQIYLHNIIGVILSGILSGWWLPNIDNAAHLGGLAAGLAMGWTAGRDIEWTWPRPQHIAGGLAVGLGCCVAVLAASGRMNDVRPVMIEVFETDSRNGMRYSQAIAAKADAARLASLIESDILPALAAERTTLGSFSTVFPPQRRILDDLRQYVALQEDAWRHRARGHREHRADLLRRSREIDEAAGAVMHRLLRAPVY